MSYIPEVKMNYALENDKEGERLEKQNSGALYSIAEEIRHIDFSHTKTMLDAGCGTGGLTRAILERFPHIDATGIDKSRLRLKEFEKMVARPVQSIVGDLSNTGLSDNSFDTIVSRFVFHHLPDPYPVLEEFKRILKPNGKIAIIDSDGIMANISVADPWLTSKLNVVVSEFPGDLFIGRKLRRLLHESGLSEVEGRLIPMHFIGKERQLEIEQWRERFIFMMPFLKDTLGNDADQFCEAYIKALESESNEFFYNKFVVTGRMT